MFRVLLRISFLFLSASASADSFSDAVEAFESNNYFKAKQAFERLAREGEPRSQRYLGDIYDRGLGVKKNYKQAMEWYKKAAMQQNAEAQFRLAVKYANGHGIAIDQQQAYAWFVLAYENGHLPAAEPLLVMRKTMSTEERQEALALAEELKKHVGK